MADPSGYCAQPGIRFRVCAKQASADCFLNECKRLFGLTCIGFGCLRAELRRRQPVFSSFNAGLRLPQGSRRVLQLAFGLDDELLLRALGSFNSLFGALKFFRCAPAH